MTAVTDVTVVTNGIVSDVTVTFGQYLVTDVTAVTNVIIVTVVNDVTIVTDVTVV